MLNWSPNGKIGSRQCARLEGHKEVYLNIMTGVTEEE